MSQVKHFQKSKKFNSVVNEFLQFANLALSNIWQYTMYHKSQTLKEPKDWQTHLTNWSRPPTANWWVLAGFTKIVYSPTFFSFSFVTTSFLQRKDNSYSVQKTQMELSVRSVIPALKRLTARIQGQHSYSDFQVNLGYSEMPSFPNKTPKTKRLKVVTRSEKSGSKWRHD